MRIEALEERRTGSAGSHQQKSKSKNNVYSDCLRQYSLCVVVLSDVDVAV